MKKIFRLLPFALLGLTFAACNDDDDNNTPIPEPEELRVLTFEDADYKGTDNGNKGFSDWSSLIDDPQYGGSLLYPSTEEWLYNWNDENNTFLASELTNNYGDYQFWGGGHAVSNYTDTDLANGDFNHQLAVYAAGGHNGSKNFCIQNGHVEEGDTYSKLPSIYFTDDTARIIDHMWVMNTTYVVNAIVNGDGQSPAFGDEDYLKAIAIGIGADGQETGRCEIMLAEGTDYLKEWTKWDLSSLGEVVKIEFNIEGTKKNDYGLTTPAYFAYDDVAVRF
ncbi:MAG: DUF4465 domain-containing protein [Alistipes sp.]|nr:DUF4465 domain-containing protein [Alistipes sp.]